MGYGGMSLGKKKLWGQYSVDTLQFGTKPDFNGGGGGSSATAAVERAEDRSDAFALATSDTGEQ
jgi:hypothetical protein